MLLLHHFKHPKSPFFSSRFHASQNRFLPPSFPLIFSILPTSQTRRNFSTQSDRPCSAFPLNSLMNHLFQSRKHLQSLFLFKKTRLSRTPFLREPLLFSSLLQSCACLSLFGPSLGFHGYLIKLGHVSADEINLGLLRMYVKLGDARNAHQLFDEMPGKTEQFFNSVIRHVGTGGFFSLVLAAFELMSNTGFSPSTESICFAIMACGELRRLDKGMLVHDIVRKTKFESGLTVGNSLVSMYVRVGRLDLAHSAFDSMPIKDVVTWNSLTYGYAQSGNWDEVFRLFQLMKQSPCVVPNMVTLLGLVLACGDAENLDQGKSLHGHCVKTALSSNFRLGTAILNMYAKCKSIECAQALFEESSFRKGLVSWNSLILGYSQNGYFQEAIMLFKDALRSDLRPDSITLSNVLPAYSSLGNLYATKSVHALIVKNGFEMRGDVVLGTALVDAYGKSSDSRAAFSIFSCIENQNVATWNALIGACCSDQESEMGMLYFRLLIRSQMSLDAVTILMLLQLCGELKTMKQSTMAHGYSLSKGFSSHIDVENAAVDMYIRCGSIEYAQRVFSLTPLKNVIIWNTMLSGFVRSGDPTSAIRHLTKMLSESKCRPDATTCTNVIQAFTAILSGNGASVAHSYIIKLGFEAETSAMNSLINAYAKSGLIEKGESVFLEMGCRRDRCSWNVMIAGCGMNGQGFKACKLFDQMESEDEYKPDWITFASLLSACSHSGLIEEGLRYFNVMVNGYKIKPRHEHWTCIVALFGRAGRVEEAYELAAKGVCESLRSDAVWGAVLEACRMNINLELGELAGRKLADMAPEKCGYQALLSNLYVSGKKWEEASEVRRVFEDGLMKKPGLSLVVC